MKLKIDIAPDIVALMVAAGERAVSAAMREAGTSLKSAWRGQITGAGLDTRLGNSIRLASFPKSGDSLNAAALVWTKAPVIIGAHDTGPLIRSKDGLWLAIPTPAAGKSAKGGRITPGEWEASPAVCFPSPRTKPAGGRGTAEHQGSRGGVALEYGARESHRADLPAGAPGQITQAAGSGAGCGTRGGRRVGADRGEVGGRQDLNRPSPSVSSLTLMANSQYHRRFTIKPIKRHISAVAEGDGPLAKFRFHILDWPPGARLITQDVHALADGFGRAAGGIGVLV
jgi:hypothetical protein